MRMYAAILISILRLHILMLLLLSINQMTSSLIRNLICFALGLAFYTALVSFRLIPLRDVAALSIGVIAHCFWDNTYLGLSPWVWLSEALVRGCSHWNEVLAREIGALWLFGWIKVNAPIEGLIDILNPEIWEVLTVVHVFSRAVVLREIAAVLVRRGNLLRVLRSARDLVKQWRLSKDLCWLLLYRVRLLLWIVLVFRCWLWLRGDRWQIGHEVGVQWGYSLADS